jgi:transcriptional regulator with PAS, ATPase and Fis domain
MLEQRDAMNAGERLPERGAHCWPAWEGAPAHSPQMREMLQIARKAAISALPVLVLGETGTGKELLARAIHRGSRRATGPFVAVNCGALSPELVVSELFGYEPGAFTGASRSGASGKFEEAHGGTLLLDEVGELPPYAQVALLRALESGEVVRIGGRAPRRVNVRIIAATNRDLAGAVAVGRFREDLYFRLNAVELLLAPLRERPDDLEALVEHLLAEAGAPGAQVTPEAMAVLRRHDWPGNVRELRNVLQRALLFAEGAVIGPGHLTLRPAAPRHPHAGDLRETKRQAVLAVLEQERGNVAAAARQLGVSRGTVYRLLREE